MFADQPALREELGKAWSCYEKALFYASTLAVPVVASSDDSYSFITDLYLGAFYLLFMRLEHVLRLYNQLRTEMQSRGISIPDRDERLIYHSRSAIGDNFLKITVDIRADYKKNLPLNRVAEKFRLNWTGLNNICRLTMEEITYLSGRVDALQSYVSTRKSLGYAVTGILASVGLSFCGIIVSILLNDAGKDKVPQRSNAALYLELGKEREKMSAMVATEAHGTLMTSDEFREKLDAINRDLHTATDDGDRSRRLPASASP